MNQMPSPYTEAPSAPGFYQTLLQPVGLPHTQPQPSTQGAVYIPPLGPTSVSMTCPLCHTQIISDVKIEPNTKTHMFALILCLIGCCFCSCIPYFVDSCKPKKHYCPNCQAYLGTYEN